MTRPSTDKGSTFLGVMSALALLLNTLWIGVILYVFIILRFILPKRWAEKLVNPLIIGITTFWVRCILWWMSNVYKVQWNIQGLDRIGMKQWFLINANHQSWVDIFVLYNTYLGKVPMLKFFIKKELGYIPIVGQAWWALDFPFMSRYSKAYLAKHPEKAGKDLEQTKKACEKFSRTPTSVMNFLEGSRFTSEKHAQQQSPFKHLLKPKAGGLAFAMQALGDKFSALTNVTIYYSGGVPTFWGMMCGAFKECTVIIDEIAIPEHFSTGDYENDPALRKEIQEWVTKIWEEKDVLLTQLEAENSAK